MTTVEQDTQDTHGTLEHLDPRTLEMDDNVRDDPALTKEFVASIAEHGVLQPITAVRDVNGVVWVRAGQRRTLAAREVGLETVPVYITATLPALVEVNPTTAQRVAEQIVENDHRQPLTGAQRVQGIQQLLDTGMSMTKAAKKLSVPQATVKAAKAIAGSQVAIDALSEGQLSLDEAAVLAEFEADENAVERLLRHAGRPTFEHTAAQLREDRAYAGELAKAEQQWRDQGYTVLSEPPRWWDVDFVRLDFLLKDGQEATVADVSNPAHWAVVLCQEARLVKKGTDEEVFEEDIDWNTQDQPDATPGEGLLHADGVEEVEAFVPESYYCTNLAEAGVTPNDRFIRFSGQQPGQFGDDADGQTPAADPGEADKAKRERRKVVQLNKLGAAAETVRREFVRGLLSRKSPPKGAAMFVAQCLSRDTQLLSYYKAHDVTTDLLGAGGDDGSPTLDGSRLNALDRMVLALPEGSDNRAQVITLGLVLGALEARTTKDAKDAWRQNHNQPWSPLGPRQYLGFLEANGYTLAPVEQIVAGTINADQVYDDLAQ